jgi:predicted DNA-binding antitoxin AbrB/MazE fold protein
MRSIEAQFEDGVLKPTERLDLRPGERVRLLVLRLSDRSRWDMKRLASAPDEDVELGLAGLDTWADALDAEDASA